MVSAVSGAQKFEEGTARQCPAQQVTPVYEQKQQ